MTKPNPKWDDPEQSKRFIEAALAAEASDDPKDDLDRALIRVARHRPSRPAKPASA
jgi:hypothetical protein